MRLASGERPASITIKPDSSSEARIRMFLAPAATNYERKSEDG
jgi:hypothetical protein